MSDYQTLKNELTEIAKILEKYPDSLKEKVFDILIKEYSEIKPPLPKKPDQGKTETDKKIVTTKNKRTTKSKIVESYTLVKDLDLRGNKSIPSFDKFVEEKKPSHNIHFNAVAVYYLSKLLEIKPITFDHLYTCYKFVNRKTSKKFKQSVFDTASTKYGYLDTNDTNDIKIPLLGVNFVEHDLPINKKRK
jgi:hypothetical protein